MRALLTNDDGVHAPGLRAFAQELVGRGFEVVVVAPDVEYSGSGASLGTIEHDAVIPVAEVELPGLPQVSAIAVSAPPALAVMAALTGAFGPSPDCVAVGVNPGFNTGVGLVHSSTVGACVTAANLGRPAVAVSCENARFGLLEAAARVGANAVAALHALDPAMALNINVPTTEGAAPVRATSLSRRSLFAMRLIREEDGLRLKHASAEADFATGTDSAAVVAGAISVTPLIGGLGIAPDGSGLQRFMEEFTQDDPRLAMTATAAEHDHT